MQLGGEAPSDYPPAMLTWEDLCNDKRLVDLPFKIELTGRGKIIMSPTDKTTRVTRFKALPVPAPLRPPRVPR